MLLKENSRKRRWVDRMPTRTYDARELRHIDRLSMNRRFEKFRFRVGSSAAVNPFAFGPLFAHGLWTLSGRRMRDASERSGIRARSRFLICMNLSFALICHLHGNARSVTEGNPKSFAISPDRSEVRGRHLVAWY